MSYTALKVLPLILSVGGTFVLASTLPVDQFGSYSAALALTQIIVGVGLLGQDQLILQGSVSPWRVLRRGALIVASSGTITIVLGLLTLRRDTWPVLIFVVATSAVLQWLMTTFVSVQRLGMDLRRAKWELILKSAYQFGINGGAVLGQTALITVVGGLAATMTSSGFLFAVFKKKFSRAEKGSWGNAGYLAGIRLGLPGIVYTLSIAVPSIYIAVKGDQAANAHSRFVILAYTAITAITAAINNEYFRAMLYRAADTTSRIVIWRRMKKVIFLLGPVMALSVGGGSFLIPALLGPQYFESGAAAAILAIGVVPQFLSSAADSLIMTNGHLTHNVIRHSLTLVISVVSCVIFPPGPFLLAIILIVNDTVGAVFYSLLRKYWGLSSMSA